MQNFLFLYFTAGAWLGVGLTDGRVGMLHWSDLSLSLLNPSLSLLWKEDDSISVHCLAWDHPNVSYLRIKQLTIREGAPLSLFWREENSI